MKDIKAETIADNLLAVFSISGLPLTIVSDVGSSLVGRVLGLVFETLGISRKSTLSYNKRSNPCERSTRVTMELIRNKLQGKDVKNWDKLLPLIEFVQRVSESDTFPISPSELVFGFRIRSVLQSAMEPFNDADDLDQSEYVTQLKSRLKQLWELQSKMRDENRKSVCERYNKTAKNITYEIGDVVLL
jgi:hypothetical protein